MERDTSDYRKEKFVSTLMSREDRSYEREQAQLFFDFIRKYFPPVGDAHYHRRVVYAVASFLITDAPKGVVEEIQRLYHKAGINLQEWEVTDNEQLYLLSEMLLSFDVLRMIDYTPEKRTDQSNGTFEDLSLFSYDCMQYENNTDMHWISSRVIVLHNYLLDAYKEFEEYQELSRVRKIAKSRSKPRRRSIGERIEQYAAVMQSVNYLNHSTSSIRRPFIEV